MLTSRLIRTLTWTTDRNGNRWALKNLDGAGNRWECMGLKAVVSGNRLSVDTGYGMRHTMHANADAAMLAAGRN